MLLKLKNNPVLIQLLTVVLALLVLYALYGTLLFNLNQHLFTFNGDGIKNYYTYAYYIQQPDSIEFTGLNHPYGEHFLYTDCTPALALTVKTIAKIFPGIQHYSIGILNGFLLFSFVLSAFFLVKTFLIFRLDPLPAVIASIGIAFLSPQVFRLSGHLALAFNAFIPYTLYFLLSWKINKQYKAAIWLLLGNLIFFYIHAYLGMITVLFQFVVAGFVFLNKTTRKESWQLFAAALLPLIIFRVLLLVTDSHEFRTTNPYGFFNYLSNITAVIFPPIGIYNFGLTLPNLQQNWEGWAYIGLAAEIGVLSTLYFGRTQIQLFFKQNFFLTSLVVASTIVLLFSFGIPFTLGLEKLVDAFPIIKNFRGVGRFSWVFYYTINVFAVVLIWKILPKFKTAAIVLFGCLALFEGSKYHTDQAEATKKTQNYFISPPEYVAYAQNEFNANEFQAILPLPFYYIGSENFGKSGTEATYEASMLLSYHLKLPIIGSYLTRTGIQESKNSMQLFGLKPNEKVIFNQLNKKPILTFHTSEALTKNELSIRNNLDSVGHFSYYWFYSGAPNQFKHGLETNTALFKTLYKSDSLETIFRAKPPIAVESTVEQYQLLAGPPEIQYDTNYTYLAYAEISNTGENACQECMPNTFFVEQKLNNEIVWLNQCNPFNSLEVGDSSSVVTLEFKPKQANGSINLFLVGPKGNQRNYKVYEWGVFKFANYP